MNVTKKSLQAVLFMCAVKLSSLVKISFLVGSQMIWFSGINSVMPLAGAFGGLLGSGMIFLGRILFHQLFFKSLSLSFLALCVPGYCASLYWATSNKLVRLFIPIMCMVLFIVHPIGRQAFVYCLYWFIPVIIFYIPRKSLFMHALASTFIAHAVGSVIWLYAVPMAPAVWIGLIPVVAIERTLFAMGMVCAYSGIVLLQGMLHSTFGVSLHRKVSLLLPNISASQS